MVECYIKYNRNAERAQELYFERHLSRKDTIRLKKYLEDSNKFYSRWNRK